MATTGDEQSLAGTPPKIPETARNSSSLDNPSKFSALVLAFLNLWLSVLLLTGAVIACITSSLIKFFRLQPPCIFVGCTRHSSYVLDARSRHANNGSSANCGVCEHSHNAERVICRDGMDRANNLDTKCEEARTWQQHFDNVASSSRKHRVIRRKKIHAVRPVGCVIAQNEGAFNETQCDADCSQLQCQGFKLSAISVDVPNDLDGVNTGTSQKSLQSGFCSTFDMVGEDGASAIDTTAKKLAAPGKQVEGNCNEMELASVNDAATTLTESMAVKKDLLEDFSTSAMTNNEKIEEKCQQEEGSGDIIEEDFKDKIEVCCMELPTQCSINDREMVEIGVKPPDYHLDASLQEDEDSDSKEIYIKGGVKELQEALKVERNTLSSLYSELEKERNAAAVAAQEAMAMIARLQEEKAAMQMEDAHYKRLVEEKAIYDQQAMTILKEILFNREREKYALEQEVELYRERFLREEEDSEKVKWLCIEQERDAEKKEPVLLLEGTEKKISTLQLGEGNADNAVCSINVSNLKDRSEDEKREKSFIGLLSDCSKAKQSTHLDQQKQLGGSSVIATFNETDERYHGESSGNISSRNQYMLQNAASSKDEVVDFVLECLHSLEAQFRELLERKEFMCSFSDSNPGNIAPISRDYVQKEQFDESPLEINSYTQKGSLAVECGKYGNQVPGIQMAMTCRSPNSHLHKRSYGADFVHPLSTEMDDPFLWKYDDVVSPVHDVYEVQHELKRLVEPETKDFFQRTAVASSEPELLSAVFSERNLLNAEPSMKGVANARSTSSHDWRDTGLNEEGKIDDWGAKSALYHNSNWPVDVHEHDFRTKFMIFKDIQLTKSQEYTESLNKRLQLLQANGEILRHALSLGASKKREIGANILEDIVQHLGDQNDSNRKTTSAWNSVGYVEPQAISSFEMHAPLIKKRRYSMGIGQDPSVLLPGTMERYNSM